MRASKNPLDYLHVVNGLFAVAPSSSTPSYISLKNAMTVLVVIKTSNAASGATGSAITLNQATAVAGTSAKALAFTDYYTKTDLATADAPWTRSTAASNTFTTDNTASKLNLYCIPVDPASLDGANSFDCFNCGTANATNTTVDVTYLVVPKYSGNPTLIQSVRLD